MSEPTIRTLLADFREDTVAQLTEVTTQLEGVNEHLARLNGSVAEHEERLNENDIAAARKEGREDVLAEIAARDEKRNLRVGDYAWRLAAIVVASAAAVFYSIQIAKEISS